MEVISEYGAESPISEGNTLSSSDARRHNDAKLKRYGIITKMRRFLAYNFLYYNMLWAGAIISILYFNNYFLKLSLSDTVIVTLLTTATLNFNGMMYVILRNIYSKQAE